MRSRHSLIISIVSIFAVLVLGASFVLAYTNGTRQGTPLIYAEKDMLQELWASYKRNYIEESSGRTLDKQLDNITTSEGQSYTMLRAVWMDDRQTFDKSWQWTKDNLQRDDSLMSWKFGRLPNGSYGVQESVGGQNTATDGDTDIALALLMAYSRWKDDDYLYDAQPIINSVWEKEVVQINKKPVLVANDLERANMEEVIVNPSYFSPYAYKIFAHVDKEHDWNGLADNSYALLDRMQSEKLDKQKSAGLAPDWVTMNRMTGEISALDNPNLTTKFSYDAIRTPWRLALDYAWFKDERSKQLLQSYKLLGSEWDKNGRLAAVYEHDGRAAATYDTPAFYGATMGYFKVIEPEKAREVYTRKLSNLYDPNEQKHAKTLSYYDDNWSWFGTALYLDELPNLTVDN
ncbi:MAG TPA: glycosyl hydrolase family 8 [Candidatus Saccharimonadales bacterium]|nr:glycosyl hydrolase family 8 [Candidatus Saccharimonadales bacterium]